MQQDTQKRENFRDVDVWIKTFFSLWTEPG